ncbi:MAG: phosphate ABC transporter permease subunit PstC [Lachnospiraceae bacterium]
MKEKVMQIVFFIAALTSVVAVVLICAFLFANGIPAMKEIGFFNFLLGDTWRPSNNLYGILPMILGSIYVTACAILIGVPIGILTSIFMAYFCPKKLYRPLKEATQLLAGIPSVVYGFFGLIVIVPAIRALFGGTGMNILTAGIILGIMILPTLTGVIESSLRTVPESYYEGALALGATHERCVFRVIFPAAKSGVVAGIVLAIGRAVGETMAVVMIAGNQPGMPTSLFKGVRTLTTNIVMEMGYAADLHREALIATGVVLFVFILLINLSVSLLNRKSKKEG